ncbi:MAG TPA: serine hydrolase [Mycobacteriales bacterium]|nr:serine hydrolase [Mycobacteriales bacterium]
MRDAATGEVLAAVAPDLVLPTASVGKLLLLLAAARADGAVLLRRDAVAPVADSGLWQHLRVPVLAVHDCAALVGAVSDNLATNVLLHHLGLDAVRAVADELGLRATGLHDVVRDVRGPGHPPQLSTGTAGELSDVLARLHRGEVDGGAQVLHWLAAGTDLSMVGAATGLDPLAHVDADRGLVLRSKTGTDAGVRADVGLLGGPRRALAYAVLASWEGDDRRDAVLSSMAAVGKRLVHYVQ